MQTILGPFYPDLENALVSEIVKGKEGDPLSPILILVPSDLVRRRLKILLTRDRGHTFVNLHLMTFQHLAFHLLSEISGARLPVLRDDLFFEEILRQLISSKQPGTETFGGMEERARGCATLWQTLRDLKDGLVQPSIVLEALNEGHLGRQTSTRMANLLRLLQTFLSVCREKGIQGNSDLESRAAEEVLSSRFLQSFERVFFYGFYDLTQVQLELFDAVARNYPTTLFFPLFRAAPDRERPSFAECFFQQYIQGRASPDSATVNLVETAAQQDKLNPAMRLFDQMLDKPDARGTAPWTCTILNAFGAQDEVAAVAKVIVHLVADQGLSFDDIGVVARALEPYASTIKDVFHRHAIPIAGFIEEPLAQFPLTQAVILLLNLPAKDYLRAHVIDVVSSPFFRLPFSDGEQTQPRPDLWDLATRELGICKGIQEWRRLENYSARDLVVSQYLNDDQVRISITADQIRHLVHVFKTLRDDLNALPPQASWCDYATAWKERLHKYLGIGANRESESLPSAERVGAEILAVLDRMAGLDVWRDSVSADYFSRTFQHWLESSRLALKSTDIKGVAVLSATAARGLSFRSLFIIGLNEGVFPRTIREDAFLRDREREILELDLGFKVNSKLAGFDEEKLIFTLLVSAARERLYCLFQRADANGRVLAPSWYIGELKRAVENRPQTQLLEATIARSIGDKADTYPFNRADLLVPEELAVRLGLEGRDATALIEAFGLSATVYRQGRHAVDRLDLSSSRLDAFDGLVKPLAEFWHRFSRRGLSPTALESYGRCPFQFFAEHVLRLQRLERPEEITSPSPADFGELGHRILKDFYQELLNRGYFAEPRPALDLETILAGAVERACADYEATNPVGYPLAWITLREDLTQVLRQIVTQDLEELSTSGYVPAALEIDVAAHLPPAWPKPLSGLTIRGRMDRVDCHRGGNRLRVIDYKFKSGAGPTKQDRDLTCAALRGERLQPVFYSLLGKQLGMRADLRLVDPDIAADFYFVAPKWDEGPLVRTSFGAEGLSGRVGEEIKDTVAFIANGIRKGRFFIQPGDYCRHCGVSEICRKNHPPSLWRAENDPVTRPHRELREKDPKKL